MNTIYALIRNGELVEVAPSFNPDDALRHFVWASTRADGGGGEMYAIRCSDPVAVRIRELTNSASTRASALQVAKSLSYSLTKCADVT